MLTFRKLTLYRASWPRRPAFASSHPSAISVVRRHKMSEQPGLSKRNRLAHRTLVLRSLRPALRSGSVMCSFGGIDMPYLFYHVILSCLWHCVLCPSPLKVTTGSDGSSVSADCGNNQDQLRQLPPLKFGYLLPFVFTLTILQTD